MLEYKCLSVDGKLDCFNLSVDDDSGVLGERDSGKDLIISATFNLINYSGEILLSGKKIDKNDFWTKISAVLYNPLDMFNPIYDIASHFVEIAESHKVYSSDAAIEVAKDFLKTVGVPEDVLYSYPNKLDNLTLKKVAIVLASFLDPEYILIDDIEYGLSELGRNIVLNTLLDLKSFIRSKYLVFDNDPKVISMLASYVVVLYKGEIVEEGKEVIKYPMHPYTVDLISGFLSDENKVNKNGCIYSLNCRFSSFKCKTVKPNYVKVGNRYVKCHGF
ncbi:ABC transporter ATP-binding protein [Acidianus sulfidivorans JP7]|uniref:Peptide ABC transporter ATP-binding protein n=1 Tax=Acidianus sulfidivorans JP7 TaxID=619593 RepID=A0A2U9IJR8_9CREN|nr:ABC transporter ATP-binding protein [Acidianus sulfidivorans]AWR96260.1 ABC transporter ATP-binding protein [Acidianus sulfidivorans JP7]